MILFSYPERIQLARLPPAPTYARTRETGTAYGLSIRGMSVQTFLRPFCGDGRWFGR
jgi:hypothetical protein